jgi:hypothetical protein
MIEGAAMTDQDELRDRIADIIYQNCEADGYTKLGTAQAIIDDLGLTVEERIDQPGKRGINPVSRIVGKWEAEE